MKSKLVRLSRLLSFTRRLRKSRQKIVFTNGTFDILHIGHVDYLQRARRLGDVLIVGVNSDRSVKSYKDPSRPINPENDRIRVLAALECVDYAVMFNDPTPLKLIRKIRPHILAKGADWKKKDIAGARDVESWGGKVKLIPLVKGKSTTAVIHKILKSGS